MTIMFKTPLFIFFSLLFLVPAFSRASALPLDSIGMEKRNGINYVVHKVVPKETLFALSRKYQVPVDKIVDANPKIQSGLQVGQLVYIPRKTPAPAAPGTAVAPAPAATASPAQALPAQAAPAPTTTPRIFVVDANGNKMHQVSDKQTLFAISRLYGVSVVDIKKWNSLTSDQVSVGDQLIVGVGNKPTASPQYAQEPDDDVDKGKNIPAQPQSVATMPATTPGKVAEPVAKAEPVTPATSAEREMETISKITESGMAEVIDKSSDNNKYLALHKSAPVGTILQVKNVMNGQSVYVRVIGKLPETGANDKVIIKISNRAYQKLAALDNRFRVEVSYMP
jgi:LysM repeat protein